MNRTKIHTTKKLERLVKKLIVPNMESKCGMLGKWNATVFNMKRKKCWLVSNGFTKYNVILADVKAADLKHIDQIFKNALYKQLQFDGIKINQETLNSIIGTLDFLPTDNDRSTTSFQNQRLLEMEWWISELETFDSMPILDFANRMNTCPIHMDKVKKSAFTDSVKEIARYLAVL